MTSPIQPEVETRRLNGEAVGSVGQRVVSAEDAHDSEYVSRLGDGRKSNFAPVVDSGCDVTQTEVEPVGKHSYSQVGAVTPSVAVTCTAVCDDGVLDSGNRMSHTGSSNGGRACADDVVGPRNSTSEHDDSYTVRRHNQHDRDQLELRTCSGISAASDIPAVILQRPENIHAGENRYDEPEVSLALHGTGTKFVDCSDTVGLDPVLTSGTTRISDVIKTAATDTRSSTRCYRLDRTVAKPEPEIAEIARTSAPEERRPAAGGPAGRFRSRTDDESRTIRATSGFAEPETDRVANAEPAPPKLDPVAPSPPYSASSGDARPDAENRSSSTASRRGVLSDFLVGSGPEAAADDVTATSDGSAGPEEDGLAAVERMLKRFDFAPLLNAVSDGDGAQRQRRRHAGHRSSPDGSRRRAAAGPPRGGGREGEKWRTRNGGAAKGQQDAEGDAAWRLHGDAAVATVRNPRRSTATSTSTTSGSSMSRGDERRSVRPRATSVPTDDETTRRRRSVSLQYTEEGGSVAEWLACWTQAQKGPGSNSSHDAVG